MSDSNWIWWTNLSNFLKGMNVIPFILIVSGWHYFKALESAGENFFIAFMIAIIVDVCHFGTVERFRDSTGFWMSFWWFLAMAAATAVALSLQYSFYATPDVQVLEIEALRNAVVIPMMVIIFGFLDKPAVETAAVPEVSAADIAAQATQEAVNELIADLLPVQKRRLQVLDMHANGKDKVAIAEALKVDQRTVGRDLKVLNGLVATP